MDKSFSNIISEHLNATDIVSNLSRKKMLVSTVCAMLQSRSVMLSELANFINDEVKTSSNETRLRDFFREVEVDYTALAEFISAFLVCKDDQKIRLTIDRTNWEFGKHSTNILMVTASNGTFTVPLFWELLDNEGGNSNSEQRIDLLRKCIDLLGVSRIGLVVGDREFIGQTWLKFLKDNNIPFCVRVPKHHLIETADGEKHLAQELFDKRQKRLHFDQCMVDGVWGSVLIDKDAKGDLLFLFGTAKVSLLDQFYKKRWTIETVFQAFKSRGFNLEHTHLNINERLKKLVALVAIAYSFCSSLGIYRNENEKSIEVKNHKRKANSFFRYGLDFFRDACKVGYKYKKQLIDLFKKFIKYIFVKNCISVT